MPSKVEKASLQQTAISAAVAVDKAALLRGRPTSITHSTMSDKAKIETAISLLMSECRAAGQQIDRAEAIKLLSAFEPAFDRADTLGKSA